MSTIYTGYTGPLYSGGVMIAAPLSDAPAIAQTARTYESASGGAPARAVERGGYTYVAVEPSPDQRNAARLAYRIAREDLGIYFDIGLGSFALSTGRAGEKVIATSPHPLRGFVYPGIGTIWVNSEQSCEGVAQAVAHEMKHLHIAANFPGISKESRETAACRYVERFWEQHSTAITSMPRHRR